MAEWSEKTMIKLITGKKGTGKTKIIIDQINDAMAENRGDVVVIEKIDTLRSYKVRWVSTEDFSIESYDAFYGFVAGMCAGNYDIVNIFVDGILKIGGADFEEFGKLLSKIDKITGKDTTVTFTVSADNSELPESVKAYIG